MVAGKAVITVFGESREVWEAILKRLEFSQAFSDCTAQAKVEGEALIYYVQCILEELTRRERRGDDE